MRPKDGLNDRRIMSVFLQTDGVKCPCEGRLNPSCDIPHKMKKGTEYEEKCSKEIKVCPFSIMTVWEWARLHPLK